MDSCLCPLFCSYTARGKCYLTCENGFLRNCVTQHWHMDRHTHTHTYTHHCDVEGIQQVKGQSCNQVDKEPGGAVMDADGAGIIHHLTRLAHIGGAEVQDDICTRRSKSSEGVDRNICRCEQSHPNSPMIRMIISV